MYIGLLFGCLIYLLYAYFSLIKKKKAFRNNEIKYTFVLISLIAVLILIVDLPYFVGVSRETTVTTNHVKIYSVGKHDGIDLITLYMDNNKKVYWSGAPIGHKEWLEYGGSYGSIRECRIKYLPITRIVVKVVEGNEVVYNNFKDLLSMSLTVFIITIGMVLIETKESIFGKKKSKYR